jgi:carbonic anhydrase
VPFSDNEASVRDDVEKIRSSPSSPTTSRCRGDIYDVNTGRLQTVVEAGG